jgi:hypothetical protein
VRLPPPVDGVREQRSGVSHVVVRAVKHAVSGTLDAVRINGTDLLEQPWEALKVPL